MRPHPSAGQPAAPLRGTPRVRSAVVRSAVVRSNVATSLAWPVRADDHTETARLERERLFQVAFERAVIGIAHVSPEGRFLRFNPRLCDFLGYTRDELAARTIEEVTHPDDVEPCAACFQRLLTGESDEYALDKRYLRKDGTPVWAHVAVSLVRTPEGAPDFTVVMIQDIDERKRLEQERTHLLEQERAARAQVEATNAQLRALQALTDTALSHLTLDDLLAELLSRVTAVLGVDQVGIFLLEADGQTLTMRAERGLLAGHLGGARCAVGQGLPGRIAASRAPLIVEAPSAADCEGVPPLVRDQLHSLAGVPLLVEEQVDGQPVSRLVGVLAIGSTTPRRFTEADIQLLQRAADRIALAIDRARLYTAEQEARQRAQASEAEAAARAAQLHTILETIADGVAVSGPDGRLLTTNRAFRELLAADHLPEFDAMSFVDRAPLLDYHYAATGEPFPTERHPVARALRGEVVAGPEAEVHLRALDGRELEANISAAPLRDGAGRVVGAVSVLRDTTWRHRLEREREAARAQAEHQAEQLDRIFEAAADGLIVYDPDGRITRENPAARRILGLDAAPPGYHRLPPRERVARYAPSDEQGRPIAVEELPIMRALRGEVGTRIGQEARDLQMRVLDGREVELHIAVAPLRDREGLLVGAVGVVHDLTERNRLGRERTAARADELAAREASRRMEAFLAVAAHDLRSPLTAALGYLGLVQRRFHQLTSAMREEHPSLARQLEAVGSHLYDADQGMKRLTRLLSLLFDTSAIQAGQLELHRTSLDLVAVVREQVAGLRVAAPERTIHLHTPIGGEPIPVEADADRIGQVVANYVTNALKYAPPERPIDVSVGVHRDQARVAVRDRGPGIPAQERARVWELFHRAPGAEAQGGLAGGVQGGSLGLGLYICKAIVEAHGGRVGVESRGGEGSTFWLTLPLADQRSVPRSSPAGAAL
jgi:PAS domain S-box-containing protein